MLAYSDTQLANLALNHLGASPLDSLETDPSTSGQACRVTFPFAFPDLVRECDWPWARKRATLALVQEKPNAEWAYAHRLFSDCVAFRRISSGQLIDDESSEIPFEEGRDLTGGLIFSNEKAPVGVYTALPANVSMLPADAAIALSYKWARMLAPRLVREDPFELAERMEREYVLALDRAKVAVLRGEKPGKMPEHRWQRSRRG